MALGPRPTAGNGLSGAEGEQGEGEDRRVVPKQALRLENLRNVLQAIPIAYLLFPTQRYVLEYDRPTVPGTQLGQQNVRERLSDGLLPHVPNVDVALNDEN